MNVGTQRGGSRSSWTAGQHEFSNKWRGSDFNLKTTCRRFGADSIALDTSCCGHTAEALTPEGVAVCTVLLDMWRGCRAVSYTTLCALGLWHGGDIFSRSDWLRIRNASMLGDGNRSSLLFTGRLLKQNVAGPRPPRKTLHKN